MMDPERKAFECAADLVKQYRSECKTLKTKLWAYRAALAAMIGVIIIWIVRQ